MHGKLKYASLLLLNLFGVNLLAQTDSSWEQPPLVKVSNYIDVFYVYDFNKPNTNIRQPFFYNYNRHNEFNLNLALLKLGLDHPKYRANFALQTGTYANDNYAAEPGLLKAASEANIGISLNKKKNLWLDAGIFPSHIGFESAISFDNSTLTRSILAENSPYFLAGTKLTYSPNPAWEIEALILNGWQRIQRLQGNNLPSFGTKVNFSPTTDKITLNWSTFIGTDDPDSTRRMRYFNNFYGQFQATKKLSLITGFDIGMQQSLKGSANYNIWFSPVIITQYSINNYYKGGIRVEYYQDKTGIIISTGTRNGFQTAGLSLYLAYSPTQNILCKIEGRWLNSRDNIFEAKPIPVNNNCFIATSIAMRFSETLRKQSK